MKRGLNNFTRVWRVSTRLEEIDYCRVWRGFVGPEQRNGVLK